MDAQQFLAEFGYIANAPGGIERLRELIYQFAVTGRLVPQQPEEGDAAVALENVTRVRQQLISEKRFKRAAKLESEHLLTPAIPLPARWRWSRLLDLGEINPRNEAGEDANATFVPMAAVSEKHGKPIGGEKALWGSISKGYTHFANGDVLLAKITPCFENGKAATVTDLKYGIGAGSTEFHVFRPITADVNSAYVYLFLRSPLFRVKGQSNMTGTAGQKRLPTDYFALCAMPLPPKDEQSRIVAKVDELMALCDTLEMQHQSRRKLQNTLRQATLQSLASAEGPRELQDSWVRMKANFGRLFSDKSDVADLEQVIRRLALQGFLTSRNEDENLSDYLVDFGSSPTQVEERETEWRLPNHWMWARCGWLGEARLGKMLDASKNKGVLTPYLRNINVRWRHFNLSDVLQMRVEDHELPRISIKRDDLVICEGGEPGRAAIWDRDEEFVIQKALHRFRCNEDLLPKYFLLCLEHDFYSGRLAKYYTGATIKHLTGKALSEYSIPLPPIGEQQRVIDAVDRFTASLEIFKRQLDKLSSSANSLAITSIAELSGIAIEQEEKEPVRIPQTELISRLRLGQAPNVKAQAPLATILARHNGELSTQDLWQRSTLDIDAFYSQLKTEVTHGWIEDPSYELDESAPDGPKKYPNGRLVAKVLVKEDT